MRTRQTMTVSLPPEMVEELERVRKAEHRTRSELIREALRTYFALGRTLPMYTPSSRELEAIKKGRAEIRRGEFSTLDDIQLSVGSHPRKARAKKARSRRSS